jgi:hypothetical protein
MMCRKCSKVVASYPNGLCIDCFDRISHNGNPTYKEGYVMTRRRFK